MKKVQLFVDGVEYVCEPKQRDDLNIEDLKIGKIYYMCDWHFHKFCDILFITDKTSFSKKQEGTRSFPVIFMNNYFIISKISDSAKYLQNLSYRYAGSNYYQVVVDESKF
jgi:hypothetical protein